MQQIDEMLTTVSQDLKKHPQITVKTSRPFTLILAKWGIKKNVNPNLLTLGMLLSVLVALPFIFVNQIWSVVVGFVVIQLFEIFDDADGIVARGTGRLSVYGEQLDYIMHLICHPLAIATYGYCVYRNLQAPVFSFLSNELLVILLCGAFIILEYGIRNFVHLDAISRLKLEQRGEVAKAGKRGFIKTCYRYFIDNFVCFPVFMQLFPIFLFVDLVAPVTVSVWVLLGEVALWLIFFLSVLLKRFIRYVK